MRFPGTCRNIMRYEKNLMDSQDQQEDACMAAAFEAQMRGDWAQACALYRTIVDGSDDVSADALSNYAHALRKMGNTDEALDYLRKAVTLPTASAAAYFNLSNILYDRDLFDEAADGYGNAVRLDPGMWQARMQLARCLARGPRWMEARQQFAEVIRLDDENFSAWLEAGHLCKRHGPADQMLACYRRAVAVSPKRWAGHLSLALALEQTGDSDGAARHYYLALHCEDTGNGQEVHRRMGIGRIEAGLTARALESLTKAIDLDPLDYEAMLQLAHALMRVGESDAGCALFERIGRSENVKALTNLAEAMNGYNMWEEAEHILREIVARAPDDWMAKFNLGAQLIRSWRMEEGSALVREAKESSKNPINGAEALLADAASRSGDARASLKRYRDIGEAEGPESTFRSSAAMASLYNDTLSPGEVVEIHRGLFASLKPSTTKRFPNTRERDRPLRIGYVSADLHHQHPVNLFLQPVLARHDKSKFEITVYSVGTAVDEQLSLAKSRVSRWRDATYLSDSRLSEIIAADEIDVLIDLMGHTTYNRRILFAKRAAPVQACFLGYPGSTGLPNMDWIVADPVVAPQEAEEFYSEKIARMPHCVFCFAPERDFPYPQFGPQHRDRPLTFGCFNNVSKLTPFTMSLWAKVLAATPGSRLLLKAPSFMDAGAIKSFTKRFGEAGIGAQQIEFRGPSSLDDMMQEYADVDIALDPFPYNGGTTTYQALWMGAPVVTLAGQTFVQRMGVSIVSAIGRPAWAAVDANEYVRIAAGLASDRDVLLEEKRSLRERMLAADGLQIDQYTLDLERAFRSMWIDYCETQNDASAGD